MLDPRWQKVVRDLWDNKSRTALVILSIAVGVVCFAGLLIARAEITSNLTDEFGQANAYDISIDLPPFDDTLVRWIASQPNVTGAQGVTVYAGEMDFDGVTHNLTLLAYDDYSHIDINKIIPEEGAWPPERGQILIERSFVQKLGVHDGDTVSIKLNTNRHYELNYAGTVHDVTIQSGLVNTRIQAFVARRTLNQLDARVDYNRLYVTIPHPETSALTLLSPRPDVNQIANDLREALRQRGVNAAGITVNQNHEHWAAAQINGIALILTLVGSLALVFSGFLVINVINGLLLQQKRIIGVMKIVGGRRIQIIAIYLVMVASFGLMALVIALPASLALGYALTAYVGPQMLNFDLQHFGLPPAILAMEIAVAMLAPMTFALFPILSATRLSAAQAISDYVVRSRSNLIDVGLAKLENLPRQTLMALRNTFRQTSRLVLTLLTLIMAGALFMAIMNVSQAVPQDVRKSLGMSAFDVQTALARAVNKLSAEQRAVAISGVVDAEGWVSTSAARLRPGDVLGGNLPFYGVPLNSRFASPSLAKGRWLAPTTQGGGIKEIIVSNALINTKETDIKLGDVITLRRSNDTTTDQKWRVVGIVNSQLPVAYGELAAVGEFAGYHGELINLLNVRIADSGIATQQKTAAEMTRVFDKEWNLQVTSTTTRTEVVNNVLDAFNVIIIVLLVVALLIALVGGLGLAGTMSLSVMERTREIGVMRSVGGRTKALRSMFITEGVLIGLLSFVIALPLSLPATVLFDNLLAGALRLSPFSFVLSPTGPPSWLAMVMAISIISSLMPAQRASQISIREALAYE